MPLKKNVQFFEGTISGTIVQPSGNSGFGLDAIFQPENSNKTFAEMTREEKEKNQHAHDRVQQTQHVLKTTSNQPTIKCVTSF